MSRTRTAICARIESRPVSAVATSTSVPYPRIATRVSEARRDAAPRRPARSRKIRIKQDGGRRDNDRRTGDDGRLELGSVLGPHPDHGGEPDQDRTHDGGRDDRGALPAATGGGVGAGPGTDWDVHGLLHALGRSDAGPRSRRMIPTEFGEGSRYPSIDAPAVIDLRALGVRPFPGRDADRRLQVR